MPDVSTERESGSHSRKAWFSTAIAASVVGGVSVATFAGWWLIRMSGDCGVVRFYEQAFAVILVGAWLVRTAMGVGLIVHGFAKKSRSIAPGTVIAIGALGKICAPPPPSQATVDQAVASLIKALRDKERFGPLRPPPVSRRVMQRSIMKILTTASRRGGNRS